MDGHARILASFEKGRGGFGETLVFFVVDVFLGGFVVEGVLKTFMWCVLIDLSF